MRFVRRVLAVCGLAATVAACGQPAAICPKPLILDRTGTLVRVAPGQAVTPQNVDFEADMRLTGMICEYTDELLTELEVNMDLEITVVRGPANASGDAEFEFFVAITDVRGTVLNKEIFEADVDLGEVGKPVVHKEGIWQRYRLLRGQSPQTYRVWSGFQLDERDREVLDRIGGR